MTATLWNALVAALVVGVDHVWRNGLVHGLRTDLVRP